MQCTEDVAAPEDPVVICLDAWRQHRSQAARRATVRASLIETMRWCQAGLDGAVSLESATWEAGHALCPATREVLERSLA